MADANTLPQTENNPDPATLIKAQFIGSGRDGTEVSNVITTPDDQLSMFNRAGAVLPPLDLLSLAHLFEMSGALRSNVEAYTTNIDSFGHRFTPVIDLDSSEAFERVKLAMMQERLLGLNPDGTPRDDVEGVLNRLDRVDDPGELPEPSEAEVRARMASLRREMIRERLAVEKFFEFCTVDESFASLRKKTRQDLETTGNGFWEVLRNAAGEIVQFNYAPSYSVRLMPLERAPASVEMDVKATLITPSKEKMLKRFRKFVQFMPGAARMSNLTWFKEFGDPRTYSSVTGGQYESPAELARKEPGVAPATELIHFKIHSSRSPYGLPRWISEMLAVVGSRHADEVNLSYFENKSVPPLAVLVSGGRLVRDDVSRLENYVKNEIRGKRNFHKIMILQAEPTEGAASGLSTGRTKIELKPLTDAQNGDAQFLKYRETNTDAIGSVFRLPRLLRGDARDFNRATAQASLEFAEKQVFGPLRREFDYFINRVVLPALGINFWTFESRGPDLSDPAELLNAVNEAAAKGNYLTPAELRKLAARGFGVEFEKIEEDWTTRPLSLTLGGITTGQVNPNDASRPAGTAPMTAQRDADAPQREPDEEGAALTKEADRLVKLHKMFAARAWEQSHDEVREAE